MIKSATANCARLLGLAATLAVAATAPALAQSYAGQTITMTVGSAPGGGYDLNARFVARHLGRFIPGQPNVIVQNMPGAAGITMVNQGVTTAPRDGSVILAIQDSTPMAQRLGTKAVRYDAAKLQGIGRLSAGNEGIMVDPRTGVKSYKDLYEKEIILGGATAGTNTVVFPTLVRNILGLKFKVAAGYKGNQEILLAMKRGEVDGLTLGLPSVYGSARDLLNPGVVVPIVQFGVKRAPEWPDAPLVGELAKSDEDRQALDVVSTGMVIGRSYWFAPEVPQERVEILRKAFEAMLKDEQVLADAKKMSILVEYGSGSELEEHVSRVLKTSDGATKRVADAMRAAN